MSYGLRDGRMIAQHIRTLRVIRVLKTVMRPIQEYCHQNGPTLNNRFAISAIPRNNSRIAMTSVYETGKLLWP